MKLDRTDRTILAELQRDGRLTNRELAEKVHLSESACLRRVRSLEEAGVIEIAQRDFSFLKDSDATIELPLGDARLKLEREAPQGFDVLAIDAFSSDAIPVHLITSEALEIYLRHMKPSGIIAFHVTNRFLDLVPVVEGLAHARGLAVAWISDNGDGKGGSSSEWVLLSADPAALAKPSIAEAAAPIEVRRDWRLWTDDFNNLVQVLK